jgi:hypothetical protein
VCVIEALNPVGADRESELFFICSSGQRSLMAAQAIAAAGYARCRKVADGFEGPLDAKYRVSRLIAAFVASRDSPIDQACASVIRDEGRTDARLYLVVLATTVAGIFGSPGWAVFVGAGMFALVSETQNASVEVETVPGDCRGGRKPHGWHPANRHVLHRSPRDRATRPGISPSGHQTESGRAPGSASGNVRCFQSMAWWPLH